jgi:DNA-directed RNA polymerase specialized sigma24 family protein
MRAGLERPRLRDTAVATWPERVIELGDVEKTGAWLHRILHNTWINAYRKQQRQPVEVAIDNLTDRQSTRYAATVPMGLRSAEVEALEALPNPEIRAALLSLP